MPENQSNNQENEGATEILDFNKPDFVFIPKGRHTFRQEGPYLVCRTCELHHAVYVGMEKLMVGEDEEGKPILKDRSEVMNSVSK